MQGFIRYWGRRTLTQEPACGEGRAPVLHRGVRHQLAARRIVKEGLAATVRQQWVLLPEGSIEPTLRQLTVEHPLQALPLKGIQLDLERRWLLGLCIARGLHAAHEARQREAIC